MLNTNIFTIRIPKEFEFLKPIYVSELVRIGREFDGGYLVPMESVKSADHVISFGVGMDLSFEAHLKEINKNLNFEIFDHTVSEPDIKKMIKVAIKALLFRDSSLIKNYKKFKKQYRFLLGDSSHFKNRITENPWFPYDVAARDIFSNYSALSCILKIDIEGAEYRILNDVKNNITKFQLVVIEFHDTDLHIKSIKDFIASISGTHKIAHFHANNYGGASAVGLPEVFELTIIRSRAEHDYKYQSNLPLIGIDSPNAPHRPDFNVIWIDN